MLNIRWCLFTGALMAFAVMFTHSHLKTTAPEDGVVTRWWDGTTQSVTSRYQNGKPARLTEYAEDGKTILVDKEWASSGKLLHQKLRLEDGRVEEKEWYFDEESLRHHIVWLSDERTTVMERHYAQNGNLTREIYKTEDASSVVLKKDYESDTGLLRETYEVLKNADQLTTYYADGIKTQEFILRGTGDRITTIYGDKGPVTRETQVKLDDSVISETFGDGGRLVRKNESFKDRGKISSVYRKNRLQYVQKYERGVLVEVREFYQSESQPLHRIISLTQGAPKVTTYREDGLLALVTIYDAEGVKVIKTIEYALDGKTIQSEKDGGVPDSIDDSHLRYNDLQSLIEEDRK